MTQKQQHPPPLFTKTITKDFIPPRHYKTVSESSATVAVVHHKDQ